ncbi:MAG: chorismate-binding protein [Gammaproteobacteria bacterium]|nr:chorismate-binding protein [Gammaproteobacteria bacterium]
MPKAWLEQRDAHLSGVNFTPHADEGFFAALRRWWSGERIEPAAQPCGGWFWLLGYEAARLIEPQLSLPENHSGWPDALAVRCAALLDIDSAARAWLWAEDHGAAEQVLADLAQPMLPVASAVTARLSVDEENERQFIDGVARIHEYLRAGDVFQVNLSRRWRIHGAAEPASLYRRLCHHNPAPFAASLAWQGRALLSSSPERLLYVNGRQVLTRPIAGTYPRGVDAAADAALRRALVKNIKERAEHVMLIDLERNDLGRVCEHGSVRVAERLKVESYAHVHHLVSEVRGELRRDIDPLQALQAVFPGGTITGCPKLRAMEIIAELEGEGRGPYTGSLGYLSLDGRLDANILIRTLVGNGPRLTFRAGAGIVADSQAAAELAETRHKARGLLRALGIE